MYICGEYLRTEPQHELWSSAAFVWTHRSDLHDAVSALGFVVVEVVQGEWRRRLHQNGGFYTCT